MQYAVIRINGKQYKASEGEEILVDKTSDTKIEPEVLFVRGEKEVKVGTPLVDGAKVTVKILGEEKGKKLHVFKYKAKSRYRRKIGSRPVYTRLQIVSIK